MLLRMFVFWDSVQFVAEEIELDALTLLTDSHLEKLGVNKLGARLKILNAIKQAYRKKKKKEMEISTIFSFSQFSNPV